MKTGHISPQYQMSKIRLCLEKDFAVFFLLYDISKLILSQIITAVTSGYFVCNS